MSITAFVVVLGVLAIALVVVLVLYLNARKAYRRKSLVLENMNNYAFLIDDQLEVKETNYYALNPQQSPDEEPRLLGNVLRCTTACEEGTCGKGLACKHCPVRFVITKSFERQKDFSDLEVSMELAGEQKQAVDVRLGGRYVSLAGHPYMVINAKDVSESKRLLRRYIDQDVPQEKEPAVPKLLFATHDVALFNRLREQLSDVCRVVYAESALQVLQRVGQGKDYGFSMVLFDESFLHANDILDQLNGRIVVVKLTTDGESGYDGRVLSVPQTIGADQLKQLLSRHFSNNNLAFSGVRRNGGTEVRS